MTVVEAVGGRSATHSYSSALFDQTGGSYRRGAQFLFDNFKPFLNTSLTKFSLVTDNLSDIVRISLNAVVLDLLGPSFLRLSQFFCILSKLLVALLAC